MREMSEFLQGCMEFQRRLACPSVKRVICDKTKENSVQIFIPYEKPFSLVL